MASLHSSRGFTLVETIVATSILITALAGVAQLLILAAQLTRQAGVSGQALIAAQEKLESLRGLPFGYDPAGNKNTAPSLEPSTDSTLFENIPPYVDWIDSSGTPLAEPGGAALVRRWRIDTWDDATPEAITIEVCVFRASNDGTGIGAAEACLSTVRTRQP